MKPTLANTSHLSVYGESAKGESDGGKRMDPWRSGSMRALVAVTDAFRRKRLIDALREAGFEAEGCDDANGTFARIAEYPTDVLLMDMVFPGLDGIGIIERLPAYKPVLYPAVALMYVKGMEPFEERARRAGAFRYIPADACPGILINACLTAAPEDRLYAAERHAGDIKRLIDEIGFQENLSGYQYIQTALKYTLSDYRLLSDMTNRLYPLTARVHTTNAAAIERGIRNSVETAWSSTAYERQNDIFGSIIDEKRGTPTNNGMIARATEYLRASIKENTK